VSWPILDPIRHPSEWPAGSATAPYNDRAVLDLREVRRVSSDGSGFFAAFHVYPNYPDFMMHEARYAKADAGDGLGRYGAYVDELRGILPGIPLLVAEFGLATGWGTAHVHPEGLDHGGLSEGRQAAGLVELFRTIAARGATGGIVFEWADEWAKKTWSTSPYMIPYDRHVLWHNAVDPEQNYGLIAWEDAREPEWQDLGGGMEASLDAAYLSLRYRLTPWDPAQGGKASLDIGLDLAPGDRGESRLWPGAPRGPQGSEFKVQVAIESGRPVSALLLVQPSYNRGRGKLYPRQSDSGEFERITSLVNAAIRTREGSGFPAEYEDGSGLPLATGTDPGLVGLDGEGRLLIRLPWSRLNVADPSSGRILLDPRPDIRNVSATDSLATLDIEAISLHAALRRDGQSEAVFLPAPDRSATIPLAGWETVQARQRPKSAYQALAAFLPSWTGR
jgi:hypothetical protein